MVEDFVPGARLKDVLKFAPEMVTKYAPKTVVLCAGENDLGDDATANQVFETFKLWVLTVITKSPQTKVVYISPKPEPATANLQSQYIVLNTLIKDWLSEVQLGGKLGFVDCFRDGVFLNNRGKPDETFFQKDKLHLSHKGYVVLFKLVKEILESLDTIRQFV